MTEHSKNWLAAYLYYDEPWEKLLVEAVKPFAEEVLELGLATKYFFIRYWEQGPHIRLRFFGDPKVLEQQVKPKLESWFKAWIAANPSSYRYPEEYAHAATKFDWYPNNSIQWMEYEPETQRYGGPLALPIGETQFVSSSNATLSIMDASEGWSYDHALGSAIQMHLSFSVAMKMDRTEAREFYGWIFQSWLPMAIPMGLSEEERPVALEKILVAFESQYQQQKEVLEPFITEFWEALEAGEEFEEEWLQRWFSEQKEVRRQLESLAQAGQIEYPDQRSPGHDRFDTTWEKLKYWSLHSSYVHMTNNRLGVQNRDEGYLGFLLWKGL